MPICAAIATLHHKEWYITASLHAKLQWQVVPYSEFDTDALGTFSGEIERTLTPLDCATEKARQALAVDGASIGLGNEGSFSADPYLLCTINQELLVAVDEQGQLLATGQYTAPINIDIVECSPSDWQTNPTIVETFIQAIPTDQAVILVAKDEQQQIIEVHKPLYEQSAIRAALDHSSSNPTVRLLELTYDLRALHCPQRQIHIARAAEDLARRLSHHCPKCGTVDFVADHKVAGLPCELCGAPTTLPKAVVARCKQCGHKETTAVMQTIASAVHCSLCNP